MTVTSVLIIFYLVNIREININVPRNIYDVLMFVLCRICALKLLVSVVYFCFYMLGSWLLSTISFKSGNSRLATCVYFRVVLIVLQPVCVFLADNLDLKETLGLTLRPMC